MALSKPTYSELRTYAQNALKNKAGITNFSESSVAGTLVNTNVSFIMGLYSLIEQLESQSSLSTATGSALDKIGELYGVTRLAAKAATTSGAGKSVCFTNPNDSEVTIPASTRVWSSKATGIVYYTNYTAVVPTTSAGGTVYVDVTAASAGNDYNVGAGSLDSHNASDQSVTVTNITAISNGSTTESDDNYRYRIANSFLARQGGNETSIRLKLLELPEVKDVVIQEMVRGTGTVDIIVVPTDRYVTQDLLDTAQAAADEVVAFGVSAKVKAPVEYPVDVTVSLTISSSGDSSLAQTLAAAAVKNYIDNLPIGDSDGSGDLIYNELLSRVMNSSTSIRDAAITFKINNKSALSVNQHVKSGERFYLQSVSVS